MRIGIFDPYLDDLGGGEKYMMTIAECLSKKHQVEVFWDTKKDIEMFLQRFPLDLSNVKIVENIFSLNFPKIKRVIQTKKYDAIIFLSDGSIPFVLSKKLYIFIQQPLTNIQSDKIKQSRVTKFIYNSKYTESFNKAKISNSQTVIYPPVSFYPKKTKKENIILHVGRFRVKNVIGIDDYKKQVVMIDAFKDMVEKGLKNWKFVLAVSIRKDDEETFEKVKRAAHGYPIEFLINKNNNQLWDIYSKAKIYWHASGFGEDLEKLPEFAEHFGISTVEAMNAGAVPVVINAGGQKEIVEDNVNGFLWNTLLELELKTGKIISDEKLMNELSKNAIESSKKFSKDRFCKEINELILS